MEKFWKVFEFSMKKILKNFWKLFLNLELRKHATRQNCRAKNSNRVSNRQNQTKNSEISSCKVNLQKCQAEVKNVANMGKLGSSNEFSHFFQHATPQLRQLILTKVRSLTSGKRVEKRTPSKSANLNGPYAIRIHHRLSLLWSCHYSL